MLWLCYVCILFDHVLLSGGDGGATPGTHSRRGKNSTPRNMGTPPSNTAETIENQFLKAMNHIKHISKKKPCTLKIYNYLQNNQASNFDYHSVEAKLNELKANGIIDDSYKIINPIQEVMNFVTEDEVTICSENSEDEPNDPHRTVTSTKIIGPEITT